MKFTKGDSVVTFEKLWYLQRAHAERYAIQSAHGDNSGLVLMLEPLKAALKELNKDTTLDSILSGRARDAYIIKLLQADGRRYTSAPEFVKLNLHFFETPDQATLQASYSDGTLIHHHVPGAPTKVPVLDMIKAVSTLEAISDRDWAVESIHVCIKDIITSETEKSLQRVENQRPDFDSELTRKNWELSWSKMVYRYLRWAITAGLHGPDGARSMEILGRDETLKRLRNAEEVISFKRIMK